MPGQVSFLPNPNGRIPYRRYLGEPGPDGYHLEQFAIGYAFEHRFNNNLQFRQNLRYTDVTNDLASVRTEGMVTDRLVARTYNYVKANAANLALDNQVQADFADRAVDPQGSVRRRLLQSERQHRLSLGRHPADRRLRAGLWHRVPSFASLAPFILRDDKQSQAGVYLQDQIKLDRWTLTLTGRQDWASTEFTSKAFFPLAGTYTREDTAQTGRVGLNYLFDVGLSPYVSYSTTFTPNLGADPPATRSGRPPARSRNRRQVQAQRIELHDHGGRLRYPSEGCSDADPLNPLFSVQTDAVRVRGVELELKGNLTRELEIVGGYSHLDPRVEKSVAGYAGKYMINTALGSGLHLGQIYLVRRAARRIRLRRAAFAMSAKPTATTSIPSLFPLTRWPTPPSAMTSAMCGESGRD